MFSSELLALSMRLLGMVLIARELGAFEQGIYSLCTQIANISVKAGSLGIDVALIYLIGQRQFDRRELVRNALALALLMSLTVTLVLACLNPHLLAGIFPDSRIDVLLLAECAVVFLILQMMNSAFLLGTHRILEYGLVKIGYGLAFLAFAVVLVWIADLQVFGGVLAYCLAALTGFSLGFILLLKSGDLGFPSLSRTISSASLKYGLKGHLGTIFQYLNYRMDFFLVGYLLDARSLGVYAVAVMTAEAIWYLPNALCTVLLTRTASSAPETNNVRTPAVARLTSSLVLCLCVLGVVFGREVILKVFGSGYSDAAAPFEVLLVGTFALSLWKVISNDLAGRGRPEYKTYSSGMALVVTLVLDLVLIPRLGLVGAAIASSAAYIVTTTMILESFCSITGVKRSSLLLPRFSDIRFLTPVKAFSTRRPC